MKKLSEEKLLSTTQVAELFQTTVGTLALWRSSGRYGIPYIKIGRKVFYRESEIEMWLKSRTYVHTHQKSA